MITLTAAAILLCSGNTTTFDAHLQVDLDKKIISGTMSDTDATHGIFDVNYENLTRDGSCLSSAEVKLCFDESRKNGKIEIYMPDEAGLFLETGTLACSEKPPLKKIKSKS